MIRALRSTGLSPQRRHRPASNRGAGVVSFPGIWVMSGQGTLCLAGGPSSVSSLPWRWVPALQGAEPAAAAGWGCLHLIPSLPERLLSHLPFHLFINHPGLLSKSGLSFRVLTGERKSGLRERVAAVLASFSYFLLLKDCFAICSPGCPGHNCEGGKIWQQPPLSPVFPPARQHPRGSCPRGHHL